MIVIQPGSMAASAESTGEPIAREEAEPGGSSRVPDRRPRLLLAASALLLSAFLIVPMLRLFAGGYVFGADWSEYLYSGPYYLSGARPLFLYPYPLLPIVYSPLSLGLGHSSLVPVYLLEVISGLLVVAGLLAGYLACRALTGSEWAGLVGGLIVAGYPLLQMEIGWGGQAQLLAFDLGFIAFWIALRRVLPELSVGFALVTGICLSVAALSELYATFTIGLAFALFLVAVLGRRLLSVRGLAIVAATLGPPAATALAVIRVLPAATNSAGGIRLWTIWRYGPVYPQLWYDLTLNNWAVGGAYIGALALYVVFRLLFRSRTATAAWLAPSTGVAALIVGAFLTPAGISYRSVYPFVFPLAFAVAELASLRSPRGPPAVRPRWRVDRRRVAWTVPVLVVASLTITGAQLGADVQIYPNSLATYAFDQGQISELFFLSHEPGAILYDSAPIDHMFVDLWATDRPIYPGPSFEPYTVTSTAKQDAVVLASSLSYGVNWIDDGRFVVLDAEPAWGQPDPGILFVQFGHLFVSIESNDFADNVSYSPVSDPSATYWTDLFNATSTTTTAAGASLTTTYAYHGYSLLRTISVAPNGTISWDYTFDFPTVLPRSVSLFISDSTSIPTAGGIQSRSACCSVAALAQQFAATPLPPVDQNYTVRASAVGASLSSQFVPIDPYGIFRLDYEATPLNASVRTFSVDFDIRPSGASDATPTAHLQSAVLASTGIQWVVLSRSSTPLILQRFVGDPTYALYRATPHYFVLRVT